MAYDNRFSGALFVVAETKETGLLAGPFQLDEKGKPQHRIVSHKEKGKTIIHIYRRNDQGEATGKPIATGFLAQATGKKGPVARGVLTYKRQKVKLCVWKKADPDTGHAFYQIRPDALMAPLPEL